MNGLHREPLLNGPKCPLADLPVTFRLLEHTDQSLRDVLRIRTVYLYHVLAVDAVSAHAANVGRNDKHSLGHSLKHCDAEPFIKTCLNIDVTRTPEGLTIANETQKSDSIAYAKKLHKILKLLTQRPLSRNIKRNVIA